jgi:autotransporter-associated beta strand protein
MGTNGRKVSLVMNDSSGFTQTLTGANTYSGNTTISSGTLILAAANPENESSTVTIAESGATLEPELRRHRHRGQALHRQTQSGEPEPTGPSATSDPADHEITGTGTLTVSSGPSAGGFASWQTANTTTGGLGDDHDNDGVSNGIEYFLGGATNTTGFTPLPGVTNTAGTLSVTWTKGSGYTGTYDTDFRVETSATLAEPWTKETLGGGNIINDSGFVKYTFPSPLGTKNSPASKSPGRNPKESQGLLTSFSNNQQSLIGNLSLFPENFQLDTRKLKSVKPTRNLLTFLVTSSLFAAVTTTSAQSTWTGATDNNWSVAGNWSQVYPTPPVPPRSSPRRVHRAIALSWGDASRTANITFDSTTGSSPYTIRALRYGPQHQASA